MKNEEEDETLFELDDELDDEVEIDPEDIIDDDHPMGSSNEIEELVEQEQGSANTVKTAGFVALLGLLGWFVASRLQKKKTAVLTDAEGDKNFKPVNFGF